MEAQKIIEMIRERDEKGTEAFLKHYGPLIQYIIAPILEDAREREECLSDIALKVWEKIETYDEEKGSWNTWLTAVARNTALNKARRSKANKLEEDFPAEAPSAEPTPEELLLKQERQSALKEVLDRLPRDKAVLLYRKYYYMQSTAQIAAELGMSQRAVEGKLYRLKKELRKMLGGGKDEQA